MSQSNMAHKKGRLNIITSSTRSGNSKMNSFFCAQDFGIAFVDITHAHAHTD